MSIRNQASNLVSQFQSDATYGEYLEDDLQPPNPPRTVYAVAREDHAIVWWDIGNIYTDRVTHFEVKRYRLEDSTGKWVLKGTSKITNIEGKTHVIRNLQPMKTYKFSVIGVNKIDKGAESKRSRAVFIEPVLPNGWFRLYDSASQKYFYYCPRSGKSTWTRPDENPYFVDSAISRHFTDREMMSLIDIYFEEIRNYELVSKYRFKDCVEELGRPCCDVRYLHRAFRELVDGYTPELVEHHKAEKKEGKKLEKDSIRTFQGFMIMIQYVKYRALRVKQNPLYVLSELAMLRMKNDNEQGNRVADWVLTKGRFINKIRYRGILSKKKSYFAPSDYLLYLRPEKKQYFTVAFEPDEIQTIENIFLYLDVDMIGQVSVDEFCRFMVCLSLTYASRNNNRSDGPPRQLSRAMSAASARNLVDGSSSAEDLLDPAFVKLFKMLDKGSKGYLKFEDFVLFFASLPSREVDARKSYLLRSSSLSSISHVSTRSFPMSEKGDGSFKFSTKSNAVMPGDAASIKALYANGSVDGDNDSVSALSLSSFSRSKIGKAESIDGMEISSVVELEEEMPTDEHALQGNEFRIVDIVECVPDLAFFAANAGDLSMLFDELLVSNKELTVWDTNKLQVADVLITKSPPWFKKAYNDFKKSAAEKINKIKGFFKKKTAIAGEEEDEVSDEGDEVSDDDVQEFDNDNDDDADISRQKKKKRQNKKKRADRHGVTFEEDASGRLQNEEEGFSLFGGNKRDTTATHGPVCFCGCGNPYFIEEDENNK